MTVVYNYPRFDEHVERADDTLEFGAFPNLLHVGQQAPDFAVIRLDAGARFQIADLWRRRDVVMEFGSFT